MYILETFDAIIRDNFKNSKIENRSHLLDLFSSIGTDDYILINDLQNLKKISQEKIVAVDLNGKGLRKIPPELFDIKNLKILDISNNSIENLEGISNFRDLQILVASGNGIKELGKEFATLKALNVFISGFNKYNDHFVLENLQNINILSFADEILKAFPECICNLKNLFLLYFRNNEIQSISPKIKHLKSLVQFNFIDNKIINIPIEIGELLNLQYLNLNHNRIVSLPSEIGNLKNLTELYLSTNRISTLPDEIIQLRNLKSLDISTNNIYELPNGLSRMSNLINLEIEGNFISEENKQEWYDFLKRLARRGFNYTNISIPSELKISLKQYLIFFKEFVKVAKKEDIHFEVRDSEEGLEIETNDYDQEKINIMNSYFYEYIDFLKNKIEGINSVGSVLDIEIELLKVKLEQQKANFEQQLKIIQFENKYLRNIIDKFLEIQIVNTKTAVILQPQGMNLNSIKYDNKEIESLKIEVSKGNIKTVIENVLKMLKINSESKSKYNEFLVIYSRVNQIEVEKNLNIIDKKQYKVELNQVVISLLDMIDDLNG